MSKHTHHKGLEQTPTDELTHLPLPIRPFESANETSWHHHGHPSYVELLNNGDAGPAVRNARLQLVEGIGGIASWGSILDPKQLVSDHPLYHYYFTGPPLPQTRREQFDYVVWASVPYIPNEAIAFINKKPQIVKMSQQQMDRLRNGELRIGGTDLVGEFLGNYLNEQDLSHLNPGIIDEFLTTSNRDRRKEIGHLLLREAASVAIDPLEKPYRQARKLGRVSIGIRELPEFLKARLGGPGRQDRFVRELRYRLAAT